MSVFPVSLPAFGESNCINSKVNATNRVILFPNTDASRFGDYCALLERAGFTLQEERTEDHLHYAAYEKDGWGVFINYFTATRELQLVTEENTAYFSYHDESRAPVAAPSLTQLQLADYGMCYILQFSDGRFLIIDGGRPFDADVERLYDHLKTHSPHEKPVIAAWLLTHAHCDHFFSLFPFFARHGGDVEVEKFLFCFPDPDDPEQYPLLEKLCTDYPDRSTNAMIREFHAMVQSMGIPAYAPHTGQRYRLGDTALHFLAGTEDTAHCTQDPNATSLIFSMELAGQTILFTGDACFGEARLPERYGNALKADILQVPHHGFGSGTDDGQIHGYKHIDPAICLLPCSHSEAFYSFGTYIPGTEFLMCSMNVKQLFVGDSTHTLPLPYTPDPSGVAELRKNFRQGRENAGARTWIFTDLRADENLIFSLLNVTYLPAQIRMELYTDKQAAIYRKKIVEAPSKSQTQLDLRDIFGTNDLPQNTAFGLRMISSLPVAISLPCHTPTYQSGAL